MQVNRIENLLLEGYKLGMKKFIALTVMSMMTASCIAYPAQPVAGPQPVYGAPAPVYAAPSYYYYPAPVALGVGIGIDGGHRR